MYALSSQTQTEFKQQCNYRHDERCEDCKGVESTLAGIERLMQDAFHPSGDDCDEALYLIRTAQHAIHTWNCHQLRTVRQDQGRSDEYTVLIVNDWAMKFLCQMHCES